MIARRNELFPETAGEPYLFRSLDETEMIARMEDSSAAYIITLDFDAKEIRCEATPNASGGSKPIVMPMGALNNSFGLRRSFMTEADRTLPDIEFNELFVQRFILKYANKPQDEAPKPEPAKKHFGRKHKKQR